MTRPGMMRARNYGLLAAFTALLGAARVGGPVLPENRAPHIPRGRQSTGHHRGYQPMSAANWGRELRRRRNRRAMRRASQRRNRA